MANNPLTIKYTESGKIQYYFRFFARIGGGDMHHIVMDTGSTGIVVSAGFIKESTPLENPPRPPSYSSSGKTYKGKWVYTSFELFGGKRGENRGFTIDKIPVFAVEGSSLVSMMGVGIRSRIYDHRFNPFLNLPQMEDTGFPKGYMLSKFNATFGYSQEEKAGFSLFSIAGDHSYLPKAGVTLTPPVKTGLARYTLNAPFLLDTGLSYMIITPIKEGPQPDRGYATDKKHHPLIQGIHTSVSLYPQTGGAPVSWSFCTDDTPDKKSPKYVRFGKPGSHGIINTGRHMMAEYDYLVDLDDQVIGLRKILK